MKRRAGARRLASALVLLFAPAAGACSLLLPAGDLSTGAPGAGTDGGGGEAAAGDGTTSGGDGTVGGEGGGDGATARDAGNHPVFDAAACATVPCAVQVAAAGEFTCALLVDHSVRCWGRNTSGQLGTGAYVDGSFQGADSVKPLVVANVAADEIAAGGWSRYEGFVCARNAGTVSCWGNDTQHELARANYDGGNGQGPYAVAQAAPVQGLSVAATSLVVGAGHACVVGGGGELTCWGDNGAGGVGRATATTYAEPGAWSGSGSAFTGAAGRNFTCVGLQSGDVSCFGNDDRGQVGVAVTDAGVRTPTAVNGVGDVLEIGARGDHACARTSTGAVWCWGRNFFGQLGGGPVGGDSPTPVSVTLPARARRVATGGEHSCAILEDDTVWCWGRNTVRSTNYAGRTTLDATTFAGQIGLSPTGGVDLMAVAPRKVAGMPGKPIDISLGYAHSCVVIEGGRVACWGTNRSSQLGRRPLPYDGGAGFQWDPQPVPGFVEW